jgi:hypothetical protein
MLSGHRLLAAELFGKTLAQCDLVDLFLPAHPLPRCHDPVKQAF